MILFDRRIVASGVFAAVASTGLAEQDLGQFSLEELMNVQVTSVTKKKQKLSRTGAATYVITQEDIRRSGMNNLTRAVQWDTSLYYVGRLDTGPVSSYTRLDTRIGWKANEKVELSVAGQNLLSPRRFEFLDGVQVNPTQTERCVVGQVTWRF
jgi:iron complex outermembrane recepter protein